MYNIEIINCLSDNYSYICFNDNEAFVVDPSEYTPIKNFLLEKNLDLKFILNTHHHHDHIGGNKELKQDYDCKIIAPKKDEKNIPDVDIFVEQDNILNILDTSCQVFEVPGHTLGHIAFYFEALNAAFTGDTLFSLGCGRLFEGTPEMMWNSLLKIRSLPENTKIYCGHEYTLSNARFIASVVNNDGIEEKIKILEKLRNTNGRSIPTLLSDEMDLNLFLKADNNEVARALGMENANALDVFTRLRSLKDNF